jgi:hypothetical protein
VAEKSERLLYSGFRHTGKAMVLVYQCWWRICREISVFFFEVRIPLVLRFISICDQFIGRRLLEYICYWSEHLIESCNPFHNR